MQFLFFFSLLLVLISFLKFTYSRSCLVFKRNFSYCVGCCGETFNEFVLRRFYSFGEHKKYDIFKWTGGAGGFKRDADADIAFLMEMKGPREGSPT